MDRSYDCSDDRLEDTIVSTRSRSSIIGVWEQLSVACLRPHFRMVRKTTISVDTPVWEFFRVLYRMVTAPMWLTDLRSVQAMDAAAMRRAKRPISKELIAFHRREQMRKLKVILKSAVTFKPINKFTLLSE